MRKRLITHLVILLLASVLVLAPFIAVPAVVGSDKSDVIASLEELREYVSDEGKLPEGAFENLKAAKGRRKALCNKINAVINQVKAGAYDGAINKLENDLKNSIINWIANEPEQWETYLVEKVNYIIGLIVGLIEEFSPVAIFTWSASVPRVNQTVTFDASASYDPDGSIVSYFWDFGDGTTITETDPITTHVYTTAGTYTVTLTVTDNDGLTDTTSQFITIEKLISSISISASPTTVKVGESTTISGSITPTRVGVTVTIGYMFGGEETWNTLTTVTTDEDSQYSYTWTPATVGIYELKASWPGDANTLPAESSIIIVDVTLLLPPVASFTYEPIDPFLDQNVTFDASASTPDGGVLIDPDSYAWDFNSDGVIDAYGMIVTHTYTAYGNYIVTLNVTDNEGSWDIATDTVRVYPRPPIANFTFLPLAPYTNETIAFNAIGSYDPDGVIVWYYWNFGDDTYRNITDTIAHHVYVDDGTYTVTLVVSDNEGLNGTVSALVTVFNRPPVAIFTESAENVYIDETITFNASASYDPDGTIASYFWDFGDGTNATGMIVDHAYVDNGVYTVTLTVTDNDEATATATSTKTVLNRPPVASFTESAETVYTGGVITFNASQSYDPDGSIVSYFWDFGDGTNITITSAFVDHVYADDGVYTVTLTVTDNDGLTATATSIKTVSNRPPVASFTENATTVLTGGVIRFDASSSEDSDGSIIGYLWDFGDETTAVGVKVKHAYEDDGAYTVTLTVIDDDGATASTSAVKTVSNRPPIAYFTENATTVKKGEVIHFDASESHDPDGYIVSYFWDFGDGTNATDVTVDHAYAEDGNYTVTLTVTDDDGASWSVNATKTVEKEAAGWPLALLAAIGLGIAALTATLLYGLYRRRKKRGTASNPGKKPIVTLYVPRSILSRFEIKQLRRSTQNSRRK